MIFIKDFFIYRFSKWIRFRWKYIRSVYVNALIFVVRVQVHPSYFLFMNMEWYSSHWTYILQLPHRKLILKLNVLTFITSILFTCLDVFRSDLFVHLFIFAWLLCGPLQCSFLSSGGNVKDQHISLLISAGLLVSIIGILTFEIQ